MYDFSTLNSFEFEKLVCDLLNLSIKKNQPRFQVFKEGKDKGIDLYSGESLIHDNIVVQIKHYVKSSNSKLKSDLKRTELPKVKLLNPESYFVVTSSELNFQDKLEIKEIFQPFIKATDNIYGRDDLNALLRTNKEIEEVHYKLWFSSITALRKIQKYKFEGRRKQFTDNILKRKLRLFVPTYSFYQSLDILKHNKYIILTGEPGVGKTTISDIIIYDYILNDYEINIIYNSITEIEESISFDKSKQVFYFDDFLGHTQAEISKSKEAENYLLKIINLIESSENKFLILNTRKFILSSFMEESERLKQSDFLKSESKIEIKAYSYGVKRRILDLHISESILDLSILNVLKDYASYICFHKNFSPRIIEFFTSELNKNFQPKEFENFIIENLANPKEIWKHAYLKQISDYDRFLLNTLYSLNGKSEKKEIEKFYNSRLDYEVRHNNFKRPIDSFNKSLRVLNEGFLSINNNLKHIEISFINPSLQDYLNYFIEENKSEKERIIKSSLKIEQWFLMFFKNYEFEKMEESYSNFFLEFNKRYHVNQESVFLTAIFIYFFIDKQNSIIVTLIKSIDDWEFIYERNIYSYNFLDRFINDSIRNIEINNAISNLDNTFFFNYINDYETIYDITNRVDLLQNNYGFSIKKYISDNIKNKFHKKSIEYFLKNVEDLFTDLFKEEYEYLLSLREKTTIEDSIYYLKKTYFFIKNYIHENIILDFTTLENKDWDEIIKINIVENIETHKKVFKTNFLNEDDIENIIDHDYSYEQNDSFESDLNSYYKEKNYSNLSNTWVEESFIKKPGLEKFTDFNIDDLDELPF